MTLESGDAESADLNPDDLEPRVRKLLEASLRVQPGDSPVLVVGETGTGKELVARALHASRGNGQGPFLVVDCATALTPPTGERARARAAVVAVVIDRLRVLHEQARGGTLLLDEVGLLPLLAQRSSARMLQQLGAANAPREAQLVATTSRDLDADVRGGRFNAELLRLLGAHRIVLPALRERPAAIAPLARAFLRRAAARCDRPAPTLVRDALDALLAHRWPGNVRELRHAMEYAAIVAPGEVILRRHLPEAVGGGSGVQARTAPTEHQFRPLRDELEALEKQRLVQALDAACGARARAASLLGMSSRMFAAKLRAHGLA